MTGFVSRAVGMLSAPFARIGMGAGAFGKLTAALGLAKHAAFALGRALLMTPVGWIALAVAAAAVLIYKYWQPIKGFFAGFAEGLRQGLAPLQPLFDGIGTALLGVWSRIQPFVQPVLDWFAEFFSVSQAAEGGARSFGETVGLWVGEKITALVGLVQGAWTQIKAAFSGGLTGILGLILNWSPLGAFYSAFAPVLSWFGVTLPARFTQFGANIISGLWNGLKAKFEEVKAWFSGVAGWFAAKFQNSNEIKSPSRLFKRFGGWMMEGLQIGLGNGSARPLAAIGSVASDLQQRFKNRSGSLSAELAASMQANSAEFAAARQAQTGGGVTIHFNPTINASGGVDANQLLDLLRRFSGDELQRLVVEALNRHQEDLARRAY